eukprot:5007843-Amphidinium_carterae.5
MGSYAIHGRIYIRACITWLGSVAPPGLSHVSGVSGMSTPRVACLRATALPCMGPPGCTSTNSPPSAAPIAIGGTHSGGGHPDDTGSRFKANPAKLPRLDLRSATDSSKAMLAMENWLFGSIPMQLFT